MQVPPGTQQTGTAPTGCSNDRGEHRVGRAGPSTYAATTTVSTGCSWWDMQSQGRVQMLLRRGRVQVQWQAERDPLLYEL